MAELEDALAGLSVGGEIICDSDEPDAKTGIILEGGEDDNNNNNVNNNNNKTKYGRENEVDFEEINGFTQADHKRQQETLTDMAELGDGGGEGDENGNGGNENGNQGEVEIENEDAGSVANEILQDVIPMGRKAEELSINEINQMKADLLFKIRSHLKSLDTKRRVCLRPKTPSSRSNLS